MVALDRSSRPPVARLTPLQIDHGLVWLQEQWPLFRLDREEYALVLSHLYPGELAAAIHRLPRYPCPTPEAILEAAKERRPTAVPKIIAKARRDLLRAG